nr:MAG TPA: hypothetical protein [Caudoviricetes sp.]
MRDFLTEIGEAYEDIKKEQDMRLAAMKAGRKKGSGRR